MEKWKDIKGHIGYQISSYGRLRSVDRTVVDWRRTKRLKGKILKPRVAARYGYLVVNLPCQGSLRTRTIHSLVADAFLGPKPEGYVIRHGSNGKHDNFATNLSYGTKSEDGLDRRRDGTHRGKPVIRSDGVAFINQSVAAEESNCFSTSISRCCLGRQKTGGGFGWKFQTETKKIGNDSTV